MDDEEPTKISQPLTYRVTQDDNVLILEALREYEYRHPDAPDVARVTLLRFDVIGRFKEHDAAYPATYLLMMALENMDECSAKYGDFS